MAVVVFGSETPSARAVRSWFPNRDVALVIMEACGSAHHWARWLNGLASIPMRGSRWGLVELVVRSID